MLLGCGQDALEADPEEVPEQVGVAARWHEDGRDGRAVITTPDGEVLTVGNDIITRRPSAEQPSLAAGPEWRPPAAGLIAWAPWRKARAPSCPTVSTELTRPNSLLATCRRWGPPPGSAERQLEQQGPESAYVMAKAKEEAGRHRGGEPAGRRKRLPAA